MTIETVRDNLRNTIKGKEAALDLYREDLKDPEHNEVTSLVPMIVAEYLEINIRELKRILVDVEACL